MSRREAFKFTLYVAGDAPNSLNALANLKALCQNLLRGRHEIEVIDVFSQPDRALADSIFMTPTLVRLSPVPARRMVGALSNPELMVRTFGIEPPTR